MGTRWSPVAMFHWFSLKVASLKNCFLFSGSLNFCVFWFSTAWLFYHPLTLLTPSSHFNSSSVIVNKIKPVLHSLATSSRPCPLFISCEHSVCWHLFGNEWLTVLGTLVPLSDPYKNRGLLSLLFSHLIIFPFWFLALLSQNRFGGGAGRGSKRV